MLRRFTIKVNIVKVIDKMFAYFYVVLLFFCTKITRNNISFFPFNSFSIKTPYGQVFLKLSYVCECECESNKNLVSLVVISFAL